MKMVYMFSLVFKTQKQEELNVFNIYASQILKIYALLLCKCPINTKFSLRALNLTSDK